ncbi:proteasome subunit beta type-3-A [Prunus yedoensis var. nudiflora]|uniref:Proteasome subunit beta type-3-A n=1 Tax=Prunus yedoensis var. nudiflora TaxID=2094558 RepID=A0A314UYC8_PRUYE|nr:proteasome subunit beta type-3-A [Prunus yedoensis var. nudiflora]
MKISHSSALWIQLEPRNQPKIVLLLALHQSPFMVLVRQCSSLRWEPEEFFEIVSQALLSSVDRDCLSGWGGHVYVVTPTEVKKRILKGRMD